MTRVRLMRSPRRACAILVTMVCPWLGPSELKADLTVGPVQWTTAEGGNGDWFELVMPASSQDSYSWTDARTAADSMTFAGMQGYLATVTSQAESDFLGSNFSNQLSDDPANAKY